ncbi:MAG: GNAT family N-acetyltransferase [Eubacteriales bacterium]
MKKAASVFLRADIHEQDVACLLDWLNDPETTEFLSDGKKSANDLRRLIHHVPPHLWRMSLNGNGWFYMIEREGEAIGFIRLSEINAVSYEVVIALGDKNVRGKGYGTAALKQCLQIAFFEQRARRVVANIYPQNTRSLRLFEKLKFRRQDNASSAVRYALTYEQYIS